MLLVEDHPLIVEFVTAHLTNANFEVISAESCCEARAVLAAQRPNLIVLDVVLDDGTGYDLCRLIRSGSEDGTLSHLANTPVLILTARADEEDRLEGFRAGADDYLTKPFIPAELVFRIQAILRRSTGVSNARLVLGPVQIEPRQRTVAVYDQPVELTLKEFDLLHLLGSNIGRVFSREELLERVWGYSFLGNTRTVDVHVNRLRQKLVLGGASEDLISTEWGVGYKLNVHEELARAVGAAV